MSGNHKVFAKLNTPAEEAYKALRTNIKFCERGRSIKVLTIGSYSPGEGKTTTAINIALSMAISGQKVLFVDADLRKPMMMKQLCGSNFKGLSNLLLDNASIDEVINDTEVNNFYYISCGIKPLNPSELVGSAGFNDFVKEVRERFDMVVFDTPPLGSVIDCAIIAAQTDGAIIVIEANTVKYQNARMIKEQLKQAGVAILGVVLNKMRKVDYKSYFNHYDYYGSRRKFSKRWLKELKKQ